MQEDNPTSPIAYRSWDDICQSKENGGLGISDLETVNKSLLIHAAYNIANNKNSFLTSVLKAKYYPNSSFWIANNSGTRSIFWFSVMKVKEELHKNAVLQLHAGNSSIWSSPGALFGNPSMTIYYCRSQFLLYLLQQLNSGPQILMNGTCTFCLTFFIPMQFRPSPPLDPYLAINTTFSVENFQQRCLHHQGDLQNPLGGKCHSAPTTGILKYSSPCQSTTASSLEKQGPTTSNQNLHLEAHPMCTTYCSSSSKVLYPH